MGDGTYDIFDIQFRLSPEVPRQELARAGCLMALNRMIHLQTAEQWRTFDDESAEIDLQRPAPASFDLVDPQMEVALTELARGGALDPDDIELVRIIRCQAREVFERLPDLLLEGKTVGTELLEVGYALLRKLEVFWARINMDSNPVFDGVEIDDDEIGASLSGVARMLVDAALAV